MLALLPVSSVTDGFIQLTDKDDLPQELVSYFEKNKEKEAEGLEAAELRPCFPEKCGLSIHRHGTIYQEQTTG